MFEDATRTPRCAEEGQHPSIESPPARGLPGQHQPRRDDEQNGIGADRAGQQVVHVHETTKEGGDAREQAEDQSDADQRLTD